MELLGDAVMDGDCSHVVEEIGAGWRIGGGRDGVE